MTNILAVLCQIGVILMTAGFLLLLVVAFAVRGTSVIHVNLTGLVACVALYVVLVYFSIRLSKTVPAQ